MPTFHNDVIDAALNKIKVSCDGVIVAQTASSTGLTGTTAIDTDNWTLADNSSGGGRKITFATHASTSVNSISCTVSGTATRLRFMDSATELMRADLSPSVVLASTDTVKINGFVVAIKDPT